MEVRRPWGACKGRAVAGGRGRSRARLSAACPPSPTVVCESENAQTATMNSTKVFALRPPRRVTRARACLFYLFIFAPFPLVILRPSSFHGAAWAGTIAALPPLHHKTRPRRPRPPPSCLTIAIVGETTRPTRAAVPAEAATIVRGGRARGVGRVPGTKACLEKCRVRAGDEMARALTKKNFGWAYADLPFSTVSRPPQSPLLPGPHCASLRRAGHPHPLPYPLPEFGRDWQAFVFGRGQARRALPAALCLKKSRARGEGRRSRRRIV